MEFYVMEYVINAARFGNFSQAAAACHVGQPALSQQIGRLEKRLGVSLFTRTPHGVLLTEAGKTFVDKSKYILQQTAELEAEMADFAGIRRGHLTLGLITSLQCIDFGGMLSAFVRRYPDISISILQSGSYPLLEELSQRNIDIAFLNKPGRPLPSSLLYEKLGEDRYDLALPDHHPLAGQKEVSISLLSGERFIFHQPGQVASELTEAACRKAGFAPQIVCRSANPATTLSMVQGGMGAAFLPREEFAERKLDGICRVRLKEPIIKETGMAWRRDSDSPLVRVLLDFARGWTREPREKANRK